MSVISNFSFIEAYYSKADLLKIVIPPQSPTSSHVMEAVATVFAYDVPQLALLVLPPQSSVQKVLMELKDLGVDARTLDLRTKDLVRMGQSPNGYASEPVLLVATPATTRGVDLPELTHVFCVGAPDTGNADAFKHIAGRVGRFGRGGKVKSYSILSRKLPLA